MLIVLKWKDRKLENLLLSTLDDFETSDLLIYYIRTLIWYYHYGKKYDKKMFIKFLGSVENDFQSMNSLLSMDDAEFSEIGEKIKEMFYKLTFKKYSKTIRKYFFYQIKLGLFIVKKPNCFLWNLF